MQKVYLVVIFLLAYQLNFAQDFHLSQIDKTIALLNPALTGNYDGWEKFSLQHRSQWIGSGTQFTTSYGMAEFSFGKNDRMNKAYAGLGLFFTNDVGGDSKISLKSGGLSLSGSLPLSRSQSISAGIQTSFNNRSADFSDLLFYSQWNGTQLDPSVNSGELNDYPAYSYLDAGAGVAYNFKNKSSNTLGRESFDFQIGASFMHLNRPNIRFNTFSDDNLFVKTCLHSNLRYGINNQSAIELSMAQFFQGQHRETNVGVFYRARLREASRSTSFVNVKYLTIGSYARFTGTLIPYFAIDLGNFKLGMSYDVEIGKISRAYKQSAEVSLSYLVSKKSIFKGNKLR